MAACLQLLSLQSQKTATATWLTRAAAPSISAVSPLQECSRVIYLLAEQLFGAVALGSTAAQLLPHRLQLVPQENHFLLGLHFHL